MRVLMIAAALALASPATAQVVKPQLSAALPMRPARR
jgi:hypothetical protein